MLNLFRQLKPGKLSLLLLGLIALILGGFYLVTLVGYTDCAWSGTAQAWVDTNKNGLWDPDELPLSQVRFLIDDLENQKVDVGDEAFSNGAGEARLHVWLLGCPAVEFEVYPDSPSGYTLTTQPRVAAEGEETLLFGFAKSN